MFFNEYTNSLHKFILFNFIYIALTHTTSCLNAGIRKKYSIIPVFSVTTLRLELKHLKHVVSTVYTLTRHFIMYTFLNVCYRQYVISQSQGSYPVHLGM